jgi:hypothetical protein
MRTKFIPLLCIFLIAGVNAGAQNLLKNGDFEASPPNGQTSRIGWNYNWSPDKSGAICTSDARTGNVGLWFYTAENSINSFTKCYQEVSCKPLTNYRAEIYLRTPENESWIAGSSAYIILTFKNSSGVSVQQVTSEKLSKVNNEWKLFSINVLSPEEASIVRYTLQLDSKKGPSVCNADNCSLAVVK